MTLDMQFMTMTTMILAGVYVGVALETFQRFKIYFKKSDLFTGIMEVLFWLAQTGILFYLLYRVNDGALRLYVLLACILGFSIYQVLFKSLYKRLLEMLIRIVYVLIIRPVMWLVRAIYLTVIFICRQIIRLLLFTLSVILFPLKLIMMILKKIIPKKIYTKVTQARQFCSTIVGNYKNRKK